MPVLTGAWPLSRCLGSRRNSAQSSPLHRASQVSPCRGWCLGRTTCSTRKDRARGQPAGGGHSYAGTGSACRGRTRSCGHGAGEVTEVTTRDRGFRVLGSDNFRQAAPSDTPGCCFSLDEGREGTAAAPELNPLPLLSPPGHVLGSALCPLSQERRLVPQGLKDRMQGRSVMFKRLLSSEDQPATGS